MAALILSACDNPKPNFQQHFIMSATSWTNGANGSNFVFGPVGYTDRWSMVDTTCAYVATLEKFDDSGNTTMTMTGSNNGGGCMSIGTYQCKFTVVDDAKLNPKTMSIACSGQTTINLAH